MKDWAANDPESLGNVLAELEDVQAGFNAGATGGKQVSLADVIVLAGVAAVEQAAADAGYAVSVPFTPGRMDATQEMTDVKSFAALEPAADGFRNYYDADASYLSPVKAMIDKANLLNLSAAEMTALVGGLRVLDANTGGADFGVFTDKPGTLSTDFFVNLLDMSTQWSPSGEYEGVYVGTDRNTGERRWTASPVDLMFGSSSELRAIAEVYAANDGGEKFVSDFASAWNKVMNNDRFDLRAVQSTNAGVAAR
jgi:catalase-peroxidase